MEDNHEIDLALNGDFDSELFDCWDAAAEQEDEQPGQRIETNDTHGSAANISNQQGDILFDDVLVDTKARESSVAWIDSTPSMDIGGTTTHHDSVHPPTYLMDGVSITLPALSQVSGSVTDTNSSAASYQNLLSGLTRLPQQLQQRSLDPRAILSSANCPPHAGTAAAHSSDTEISLMPSTAAVSDAPTMAQQNPVIHQELPFDVTNAALLPLAMNALAAGVTLPLPLVLQAAQQALSQSQLLSQGGPNQISRLAFGAAPGGESNLNNTASFSASASTKRTTSQNQHASSNGPPLILPEPSAELRANFLASQRAAGFPLLDSNQYHFGVSVNGFHPQSNMGVQSNVGTGKRSHTKGMKNVKEQRRTKQITDLIDDLRLKMEKDGWHVGLNKSKFNTLSCCADYVRHLVKITQEKEATVKKTQCDLEAARKKLDDEKNQSDRSEPESTTSSLTVSSNSASNHEATCTRDKNASKRKESPEEANMCSEEKPNTKRLRYQHSIASSNGSDSDTKQQRDNATENTESESDLTDSNKGWCSHSGSGTDRSDQVRESDRNQEESEEDVYSDAAVANRKADEPYDSTSKQSMKRKAYVNSVKSTRQSGPELDYEEIFLNSNIPQLLASTDGRILAWNSFFLKATGMTVASINSATIFGLVRCSKLASLFEIVAKALRNKSQHIDNYLATTLPCIKFRACENKQLYITVTLMSDVDPRKRCFHCVLTDSPPTSESPGPVTEELLLMLLSENADNSKPASTRPRTSSCQKTDSKGVPASDETKAEIDVADDEEGTVDDDPDSVEEEQDTGDDEAKGEPDE